MSHLRVVLTLAAAAALLGVLPAGCGSSDSSAAPPPDARSATPAGTLSVPDAKTGFVLTPGQSATLSVVFKDASGKPSAGQLVWFVAPRAGAAVASGASGTFVGADPADPSYLPVLTDASGVATAKLIANATPGPYLVEVSIDSSITGTYGVTNFAAAPAPAVSADAARRAVEALAPSGLPFPAPRLHGPVLLDKGASFVAQGAAGPGAPLAALSWFFWIDDLPGAAFDHPARFVVLDATQPGAAPAVTSVTTWPNVALGAETPRPLFPARALEGPPVSAPTTLGTRSITQALDNAGQSCAAIVYGAVGNWWKLDAYHLENTFRRAGMSHVEVTPQPSTMVDLRAQLDAIKNDPNCKCVYVYLGSHGKVGSIEIPAQSNGSAFADSYTSYADIAAELKARFSAPGVKVKLLLNGCYTASAVSAFDGIGLDGELFTAADASHESGHHENAFAVVQPDPNLLPVYTSVVDDFGFAMGDAFATAAAADDAFAMASGKEPLIKERGGSCFTLHPQTLPGAPVVRTFGADPIGATFDQASFTTRYGVMIHNPHCEPITYTWSGPDCSTWEPQTATKSVAPEVLTYMSWMHADARNGGGCPLDHPSHDNATIKLTIVAPKSTIECSFVGAATAIGPACVVK